MSRSNLPGKPGTRQARRASKQWAATVGPTTVAAIQAILTSRKIVEQSNRSCLGVMSLAKKQGGTTRLEDTCGRALAATPAPSYTLIKKLWAIWEPTDPPPSKLHRLRRHAALAQPGADIADIKAMPVRSVDPELIARLAVGNYLQTHQDVILQGPTGAGKTYAACALGNKACQQYRTVLYLPADELFDRLTIAERTGERKRCLDMLVTVELLIIDDWFLTAPSRQQIQQLDTLIDRRHKTESTIYCTQLPPGQWHDRMEEKILADAIIDRITTNAHATVLTCEESMRKHFSPLG